MRGGNMPIPGGPGTPRFDDREVVGAVGVLQDVEPQAAGFMSTVVGQAAQQRGRITGGRHVDVRSAGSRSCRRKSRSNMATAPTKRS